MGYLGSVQSNNFTASILCFALEVFRRLKKTLTRWDPRDHLMTSLEKLKLRWKSSNGSFEYVIISCHYFLFYRCVMSKTILWADIQYLQCLAMSSTPFPDSIVLFFSKRFFYYTETSNYSSWWLTRAQESFKPIEFCDDSRIFTLLFARPLYMKLLPRSTSFLVIGWIVQSGSVLLTFSPVRDKLLRLYGQKTATKSHISRHVLPLKLLSSMLIQYLFLSLCNNNMWFKRVA